MTPAHTAQLVRSAQRDEPGALEQLFDHWLPVVLAWCIRLGGPRVHAEDVAHDVFELVIARIDSIHSPEAFPAWLYGVTRRMLARHRRRAWLRRWSPGASTESVDPHADPCRHSQQSQIAKRVWDALNQLPLHHREVLVLCDLEERSDSEAAALLGINKNTVKSRLRRARGRLRTLVGDLRDDPALVHPARGGR